MLDDSLYREGLALAYHRGFADHAQVSVPGILELLDPVRIQQGLVLELGCGSGLLTRELIMDGHRVIATDTSAAMLRLAREYAPGAVEIRQLTLPGDPIPEVDAIVSVGHVLSYLASESAIYDALVSISRALRPGGIFAIDVVDLEYGATRSESRTVGRFGQDWACIIEYATPKRNLFVRRIVTFIANGDGSYRRDDEWHTHVLVDCSRIPGVFAAEGVEVEVASGFGAERLPPGLRVLIGRRPELWCPVDETVACLSLLLWRRRWSPRPRVPRRAPPAPFATPL
jgi:SAM-dependent methyltransferase